MKENFTAKDLVSIISACHKARVRRMSWGDLSFDFYIEGEDEVVPENLVEPAATEINQTLQFEDPLLGEIEKQTLLMEDPAAYEAMIMQEQKEGDPDAVLAKRFEQNVHGRRHGT